MAVETMTRPKRGPFYCRDCGKEIFGGRFIYCSDCRDQSVNNMQRAYREANRKRIQLRDRNNQAQQCIRVYNAYGGCCVCCGEDYWPYLQIDHTNNNGSEHRKLIGLINGGNFYDWIERNSYPQDEYYHLQILCANCHWAKTRGWGCNHKETIHEYYSF